MSKTELSSQSTKDSIGYLSEINFNDSERKMLGGFRKCTTTTIDWNTTSKIIYLSTDVLVYPDEEELSELKNLFPIKWKETIIEHKTFYDNQNHGIKYILQNWDGCDITQKLVTDNANFLKSLGSRELATLIGYTHQGDQLANKYILQDSSRLEDGNIDVENVHAFDNYVLNEWRMYNLYDFLNPIYFQVTENFNKFYDLTHKELTNSLRNLRELRSIRTNDSKDEFLNVVDFAVKTYVEDLKEIFSQAPPVDKSFSVFRGTKNWYYGVKNNIFKTRTFTSTSLDPESALIFAFEDCCLTQFILKPGARVIFMEPITQHKGENEILIPPGAEFELVQNRIKPLYKIKSSTTKEDIACGIIESEKIDIRITVFRQV